MADARNEKQLAWEQGYIDKVDYIEQIRASREAASQVYEAALLAENQTSESFGATSPPITGAIASGGSTFDLTKMIISANEGGYTTVVGSDNGHGVSIGKFQWHEGRALELLLKMRSVDSVLFDSTLNAAGGSSVIDKLSISNWDELKFNSNEVNATKKLLEIPKFQAIQDQIADRDLQNYISKASDAGLTDPKAIAYFADLYNQSPARAVDIATVAVRNGGTLEAIHQAAMGNSVMNRYKSRRDATYSKLATAMVTDISIGNVNTGAIALATISNGRVILPNVDRKDNQAQLYKIVKGMSSNQFARLDPKYFSFPNGQHSNLFLPHFAQIMYLVHQAVTPLLGVDKLVISSGLRTKVVAEAKAMGVKSVDPHMAGIALDVFINGGGKKRFIVADAAWSVGIRAIGVGADHVHIDAGPAATWREHDETKIYKGPGRFE